VSRKTRPMRFAVEGPQTLQPIERSALMKLGAVELAEQLRLAITKAQRAPVGVRTCWA
jgi:hypothetical protein